MDSHEKNFDFAHNLHTNLRVLLDVPKPFIRCYSNQWTIRNECECFPVCLHIRVMNFPGKMHHQRILATSYCVEHFRSNAILSQAQL